MLQDTPEEVEQMRQSFAQSTMTFIRMNNINRNLFVNIDETAVYFDSQSNYTVCEGGAKTVSVLRGSSMNERCTFCIAVTADGT